MANKRSQQESPSVPSVIHISQSNKRRRVSDLSITLFGMTAALDAVSTASTVSLDSNASKTKAAEAPTAAKQGMERVGTSKPTVIPDYGEDILKTDAGSDIQSPLPALLSALASPQPKPASFPLPEGRPLPAAPCLVNLLQFASSKPLK